MLDQTHTKQLINLYKKVLLIRLTEVKIAVTNPEEIYGPIHLMIGQEFIMSALSQFFDHKKYGDVIYGTHRSHACFLALSEDPKSLFAELLGKEVGCSKGMGGSMHISYPSCGFLGSSAIISSVVPMAVGSALRLKNKEGIAVCFFGDGGCEEGVVHESLNLAATWELPTMFLCINNQIASHLDIQTRQTSSSMSRFASPHGIKHYIVIAADHHNILDTFEKAFNYMRRTRLPVFIEVITTKMSAHVGVTEKKDGYYDRGEFKTSFHIDKYRILEESLNKLSEDIRQQVAEIKKLTHQKVDQAWEEAKKGSPPVKEQLYQFIGND